MSEGDDTKPARGTRDSQRPWIEILRIFAWPMFGLLVLGLFWRPLYTLLDALPNIVANSESVTVGSLSIRVGKNLSEQESQEVRDALSGMTDEDVRTVLEEDLVNDHYYVGDADDAVRRWLRLKRLGVVAEISKRELQEIGKKYNETYSYGIRPTEKYDKVRRFLTDIVLDALSAVKLKPVGNSP